MPTFPIVLLTAALLCSLVAGFLFAFAAVVMPGLRRLDDAAFLRAFQAVDGVIQRGQPVFMLVWLGSTLALIAAAALSSTLPSPERIALLAAAVAYVVGVQAPTIIVNIPLNNAVKQLNFDALDAQAIRTARVTFEPRWNRWNLLRTICAAAVSLALLLILQRV